MPVEAVFNTPSAKDPSATRRRAGTTGDGKGFVLPQPGEPAGSGTAEPGRAATGAEKPAAAAGQKVAAEATKAVEKPADQGKPALSSKARLQTPSAPPGSFTGTPSGFLAAAQAQAGASEAAVPGEVDPKDKAGRKDADAKKIDAASQEKAEKDQPALADSGAGDEIASVAPPAAAVPAPALQPVVAMISLAPPAASAVGGKPDEDDAAKDGAVSAAPPQKGAVQDALAARAARIARSDSPAAGPAAGSATLPSAPALPGGHPLPAEHGHKAADSADMADAAASPIKTETAPGPQPPSGALPAQATPAAATEAKPADALQQALAPIDLGALVQQAVGGAEAAKLLAPFDQAAATTAGTPTAGQGQAALPPTPLHVLPIEIGLRALSGAKQFDIRLDPDDLGRVDVNLSISDKGEVSARLVVDRVETLHLLQRDARTLERAFEQAGLKPSDGGVDISLRDPSDQSAFRQQQRQHEEAPQRSRQPLPAETGDDAVLPTSTAPQRRLVRLGGVDLSI